MSANHPTPNFVDPPSLAPMVVGVCTAMACTSLLFVSLRVLTRFKLMSISLDDILICIAWILSSGVASGVALSTKYGLGRHGWDIPPSWFPMSGKLAYLFTALYNPTLLFTKTSILTFYLNKLGTEKWFRRICWGVMGYVICSSTSIFLSNVFQCRPIAGGWDRMILPRKCINTTPLYIFSGTNNLVTDLVLLFLPMPIIWKLRLPLRQKLGLVFVFSMGAFVTCISFVRLHMVMIADKSHDLSWTGAASSTWSVVELNVAIICACMPAFKQFLSWVLPGVMGSTVQKSQYYDPRGSSGGLKYHDGANGLKNPHKLKSTRSAHGPNITTITATHHDGDSEEYIMNNLDGGSGSNAGINKTVEVVVESEVKDDISQTDGRKDWQV